MTDQFATEVDLPALAEEVFRYLTDPAAMIRWMGQHAVLKPVPGGAFEIDINGVPVRGQYLEIDPPRRVLVSWGVAGNSAMPPGATEVEFTLTPIPHGTRSPEDFTASYPGHRQTGERGCHDGADSTLMTSVPAGGPAAIMASTRARTPGRQAGP